MRGWVLWWVLVVCCCDTSMRFNWTCIFRLPDNWVYDLSDLRKTTAPDYTYRNEDHMFVINFCGPAIRQCNGLENNFASIWNFTSRRCLMPIATIDPEVTYIDPVNVYRGIKLTYANQHEMTLFEIKCDPAYDTLAFLKAQHSNMMTYALFKSKHVCRSFAMEQSVGWGLRSLSLFAIFLAICLFLLAESCLCRRSLAQSNVIEMLPQREFFMNLVLKLKQCFRSISVSSPSSPAVYFSLLIWHLCRGWIECCL